MLVRNWRTLSELAKKLRAIPEEKRKVIVLVGRHLNEGSYHIAVNHHEAWEKNGAVAVQIPPAWTPQGFWHSARKLQLDAEEIVKKIGELQTDADVLTFLEREGFDVPVVNLHCTPIDLNKRWNADRIRDIVERRQLVFYVAGKSKIPCSAVFFKGNEELTHPHEVLAEFVFPEKTRDGKGAHDFAKQFSLPPEVRAYQEFLVNERKLAEIRHTYLSAPNLTRDALNHFNAAHARLFDQVLYFLAANGLKKVGRQAIE